MKRLISIAVTTFFILGCSTFHSRMFIVEEQQEPVNGLTINPSIVAYQNTVNRYKDFEADNSYWVEISVADTLTYFPSKLLEGSSNHEQLANIQGKFRERVMKSFTVDTVVVRYLPSGDEDTLAAVRDIPGWKWELKIRFGTVRVPRDIDSLQIVIPYRTLDSTSNQLLTDTMIFSMKRYEFHEKAFWGPDIPKTADEIPNPDSAKAN